MPIGVVLTIYLSTYLSDYECIYRSKYVYGSLSLGVLKFKVMARNFELTGSTTNSQSATQG